MFASLATDYIFLSYSLTLSGIEPRSRSPQPSPYICRGIPATCHISGVCFFFRLPSYKCRGEGIACSTYYVTEFLQHVYQAIVIVWRCGNLVSGKEREASCLRSLFRSDPRALENRSKGSVLMNIPRRAELCRTMTDLTSSPHHVQSADER